MHQPTWSAVRCNSSRTTFIKGAMPNQAKKHRKKAIHDMWKARMGAAEKLNSAIRAALASEECMASPSSLQQTGTRKAQFPPSCRDRQFAQLVCADSSSKSNAARSNAGGKPRL